MIQEDEQLLLKDLCARLFYGVKVQYDNGIYNIDYISALYDEIKLDIPDNYTIGISEIKPYLRPMSSMTEEEARDIAILHGYNPVEILSTKVTDEYIDIIHDDCTGSTITSTIWYDEIISSLECFDYLNKKMLDYQSLIPNGLALEAPEGMYKL